MKKILLLMQRSNTSKHVMPDLSRHPVASMASGFRRNDRFRDTVAGLMTLIWSIFLLIPRPVLGAEALRLRHIGSLYADGKGVGLSRPEGVACGEQAKFVIADTGNGRLLSCTLEEGNLKGGDPLAPAEISSPLIAHMNSRGEILVLDGKQRKIARLGSDGIFQGFIEPMGLPAPQTYMVKNFKIAGEELYLLDIYNSRVIVLDGGGKYLRHIPFPADYGFLSDLAVDAKGTVFVLDSVKKIISAAAKEAKGFSPFSVKLAEYANFPANMAVDARGIIYLTDQDGSSIVAIGRDGAFRGRALALGWKEGLLNRPTQICVNGKGEVYIADSANNRVQVYTILE